MDEVRIHCDRVLSSVWRDCRQFVFSSFIMLCWYVCIVCVYWTVMCVCERDREGLQKLPKLCRAFGATICFVFCFSKQFSPNVWLSFIVYFHLTLLEKLVSKFSNGFLFYFQVFAILNRPQHESLTSSLSFRTPLVHTSHQKIGDAPVKNHEYFQ